MFDPLDNVLLPSEAWDEARTTSRALNSDLFDTEQIVLIRENCRRIGYVRLEKCRVDTCRSMAAIHVETKRPFLFGATERVLRCLDCGEKSVTTTLY